MISVLTLTYKRHDLLEECIQSFLEQDRGDCELVIINDDPSVQYEMDQTYENIQIYNYTARFSCIGSKLREGFNKVNFPWIYRLDDDDLLNRGALDILSLTAEQHPEFDLWRSSEVEYFNNNVYQGRGSSVNNGNMFSSKYISSIPRWDMFKAEDTYMVFGLSPNTYTIEQPTMLYRWGMRTYHISAVDPDTKEGVYSYVDSISNSESGKATLVPRFKQDYYGQIT